MEKGKSRENLRERLVRLLTETGEEDRRRMIFREPEYAYIPTNESAEGEQWDQCSTEGDWFSVGMGKRICDRRKARSMTQAELAGRLHVSRDKISRIERGKVNLYSQDVNQICRALDCMLTEIWPDESVIWQRGGSYSPGMERAMRQLKEELDRELEEEP